MFVNNICFTNKTVLLCKFEKEEYVCIQKQFKERKG